ncbi:MAG: prepilin-type N-terminal cleavage/methylation domain-containing protein [Deltaproteobacteria bacterium]|nr:prepilin-type N-terminal cleavage/methylation domain-containing protein [Candidatus Anaeroferrophillus wilburensis]MBN2889306.1 prepilin-type N-terminal cleavage/methylation domain-containing protein [Deltaproteobacteria bacterium]
MSTMKMIRVQSRSHFFGKQGFTLVELMITVAILAVLATVAIPLYRNYLNRARQSDAIIGLKASQMAQEQFFSENNRYCDTICLLPGFGNTNVNSFNKGVYTLTVNNSAATTFVLEALAVIDGSTDRWTIDQDDINPVADTAMPGLPGFSVFRWIFD